MATPAEADDSTLKRRARRRLIGAVALALVAVIILPIVFEVERKPLDADISIQIPNKDVVVTKGPGASNLPGDGKATAAADTKTDTQSGTSAGAKSEAASAAKADAISPAKSDVKGEVRADAKADVKAEAKADAKASAGAKSAEARSVQELAEEKRAAAILNAQADAGAAGKGVASPKSPVAEGAFAVQVGAFAAEDKVKEVRDKLSASGIKTYIEKLDTKDGERTRVRAGPFAAREAADATREQIRGLGFANASVVPR